MPSSPSLCSFAGVAYRATTYDTPLWVFPNRRPGRWNDPADGTIVQYCCLDPAAPLAEYARHEDLRRPEDAIEARVGLWQLRIREGAVLNLSTPELAEEHGVRWSDLVADDPVACRELGGEAVSNSARGIIAPSAALPGSSTLVLFGARSELSWERPARLSVQVPARRLLTGAPQPGVLRGTRYRGDDYPADAMPEPIGHLVR